MSSIKSDKSTKKLKQVCLPFKQVNSPGDDANSKCRKRKLSGTENDETRVENPMVELLNGGTKCFIKSEDENKTHSSEETHENVNNKMDTTESILDKSVEKTEKDISGDDSSNHFENIKDVKEDLKSISSNSDISEDTIVKSTSNDVQLENNSPTLNTPTPKRKFKKQESAKKQEERLRLKQEKEKEKERAKEEKLKEQAEKQRLIEQKKIADMEAKRLRELEKEREKKQKEEEKKAKELEKEQERKQKEEEKKAKELEKERERKQKEQEKKSKELEKEKQKEEKLLKEEMEKKKKEKTKAAFIGFFKQKSFDLDTSKKDNEIINQEQETYFMPFQAKQDMQMAPFCRAYLNNDKKKCLDKCISQCENNKDVLYLSLLKAGKYKPSKSEKTWPVHVEDNNDVIIIETGSKNDEDFNNVDICQKHTSSKIHWKLLQFDENKRPPYWGTWRKKSLYIKPRRPFACDNIMFDYEVYSDDEWEEEDPGESIHGTDNEEEPEDDYEVDNDVFVPHGYLSDEEGDQDNDNSSKESQKEKLKLLGEEFEAEIKKKTERIKPRLVGCIWIPNNVTNPENVSKPVADTLLKYRCIWDDEEPISTEEIIINSPNDLTASENKKILFLPNSIMPDLIKFIHANTGGIKMIAKNFINELEKNGRNVNDNTISLASVKKTIKHIATKSTNVAPWYVSKENFEKYDLEYIKDLGVESPKSTKSTITKITSFMTPQSEKTNPTFLDKSCIEMEQKLPEPEKTDFIPKNIFNAKGNSSQTKEEQKINIIGGKKRITPILLSPKKKFKLLNRMPKDNSLSPETKLVDESIINPNLTNETI